MGGYDHNPLLEAKCVRSVTSPPGRARTLCSYLLNAVYPQKLPKNYSSGVTASSAAASGPRSSRTAKPSAVRIGILRLTALSYFDPAFSPAMRNEVFFDTEPVTLPPRAVSSAPA